MKLHQEDRNDRPSPVLNGILKSNIRHSAVHSLPASDVHEKKHVKGPSTTPSSLTERKNPSIFLGEQSIYWRKKLFLNLKKKIQTLFCDSYDLELLRLFKIVFAVSSGKTFRIAPLKIASMPLKIYCPCPEILKKVEY